MKRVAILQQVQNPPRCERSRGSRSSTGKLLAKKRQYELFTNKKFFCVFLCVFCFLVLCVCVFFVCVCVCVFLCVFVLCVFVCVVLGSVCFFVLVFCGPDSQQFHLTWIGKRGAVKNIRFDFSSVDSKGLQNHDCEIASCVQHGKNVLASERIGRLDLCLDLGTDGRPH